jgi:hypothetical protein
MISEQARVAGKPEHPSRIEHRASLYVDTA